MWVVDVAIQGNRSGAIVSTSGAVVNLGGWGTWASTIERNGTSETPTVAANTAGDVWILPYAVIRNNPGIGADATQSGRLYVCCGEQTGRPLLCTGFNCRDTERYTSNDQQDVLSRMDSADAFAGLGGAEIELGKLGVTVAGVPK